MSQLATELRGGDQTISNVEFLGSTFAERRAALRQVDAFKGMVEQALADSVAVLQGVPVTMTFRPSTLHTRGSQFAYPCYSISDEVRKPVTKQVTVRDVNAKLQSATLTEGDFQDDSYDCTWTVRLGNIVEITPLQEAEQSPDS